MEKNSKDVDNLVAIPSIFAEYAYSDTVSVGLDYIPFKADVSDKTHKRSDTEISVTELRLLRRLQNSVCSGGTKDHVTLYVNYNLDSGLYLKGGVAMLLLTQKIFRTGFKYGNVETGVVLGFGVDLEIGELKFFTRIMKILV